MRVDDEQQVREALWQGRQGRQGRQAPPQATFDEIAAEVPRRSAPRHAAVVAELSALGEWGPAMAPASGGTEPEPEPEPDPVRCPQGQEPMQRRGDRTRRVASRQGAEGRVRRAYSVCPVCGTGHCPPG